MGERVNEGSGMALAEAVVGYWVLGLAALLLCCRHPRGQNKRWHGTYPRLDLS